jgi:death-on-curing protein
MPEPRWLRVEDILQLHGEVLTATGGAPGLRDRPLLESAFARPLNAWAYEGVSDLTTLAAIYGVAVAKNHPFVDGNKRAAFMALTLFLDLNWIDLTATNEDATQTMSGVAAGEIGIDALAAWIRANSVSA